MILNWELLQIAIRGCRQWKETKKRECYNKASFCFVKYKQMHLQKNADCGEARKARLIQA
jgi:hypothetical protein